MSEEETREKLEPRTLSIIAFIVGIASFLCMLMITTWFVWTNTVSPDGMYDVFDAIKVFRFILMFILFISYVLLVAIGLVLSIITLFIERNLYFQLLPFVYVVAGIGLCLVCYFFS